MQIKEIQNCLQIKIQDSEAFVLLKALNFFFPSGYLLFISLILIFSLGLIGVSELMRNVINFLFMEKNFLSYFGFKKGPP